MPGNERTNSPTKKSPPVGDKLSLTENGRSRRQRTVMRSICLSALNPQPLRVPIRILIMIGGLTK